MKAWFVSDIHLRDINERNSIKLLRFLHLVRQDKQVTHLFFLGDIFDLWVGDSDVFQSKFQALVDVISDIKRRGVEVVYFEGNHDLHVKNFWESKFSIPTLTDHKTFQLGSFKVRMEHGDFINPNDKAYIKFRKFMRSSPLEKVAYLLPGQVLDSVGIAASRLSRKKSAVRRKDNEDQLRSMIRDYAQTVAEKDDFDLIVTGHMHIRDEFQFQMGSKKITSVNLGSWFEEPAAFCVDDQGWSFHPIT